MAPRVLLLNPPGRKPYLRDHWCSHVSKGRYLWQPYDLLALSGPLAGCTDLSALDAIAQGCGADAALQQCIAARPQVIIAQSGAVSWQEDVAFFSRLKAALPQVRLLVTGEWWMFEPERRLGEHPQVDGVLLDFTDCGIDGLVTGLVEGLGGPSDGAPRNVALRTDSGVRVFRGPPARGEFRLGRLAHHLFSGPAYDLPQARRAPLGSVMGVLSCPWSCRFCPFERIPHRLRALDDLLADLDHLAALGVAELWWKDQSFGAPRGRALSLLGAMADRGHGFSWSCETRPDLVDAQMLDALQAAGCHTLLMGVEAASDDVLQRAHKGYDLATVRRAFADARAAGMRTLAHLCLGLPGEDAASLGAVEDLVADLAPDFLAVNVAAPMVGTSFREEAEAQGWIAAEHTMLDSSVSPPATVLPSIGADEIWQARQALVRGFYLRPAWAAARLGELQEPAQAWRLAREGLRFLRGELSR